MVGLCSWICLCHDPILMTTLLRQYNLFKEVYMFAKRFLKIMIFSLFVFAVCPFVSAECVRVGDSVKFVDIKKYIDHFSSIDMEKDEFESMVEYKNRINTEANKVDLKGVLIETSKDLKQLKYDLENQRFYFNGYFFGNSTYSFVKYSLQDSEQFEKFIDWTQVAYLPVVSTDKSLGAYQAQNAMGANFTVQKKIAHRAFLVSYRDKDNKFFDEFQNVILLDEGQDPEEKYLTPKKIAYLSMGREMARSIKDNLKTGVVVDFVYPYYVSGKRRIDPTIKNRNDVLVISDNFLVSFKCGFITDPNDKVLKVVKTIQD